LIEDKADVDVNEIIEEKADVVDNNKQPIPESTLLSNTDNTTTSLQFYESLINVKKMQENILYNTTMAKEKIKYANEVSVDHLKTFKEESEKYGKYLKQIHNELYMIQDLIKYLYPLTSRKIKTEINI
jgi:hypothetical protein